MSGYRFCRTDDVPLLVEAYNRCYAVHFEDEPPLTVDEFKRNIRELNLWSSSCMVASAGGEPIGVLLATKRGHEALIYRVGVHPDHQRNGHGHHLLNSLSQKLAVLGPPRLVAEIPSGWSQVRSFFEYSGYLPETTYADFAMDTPPPPVSTGDAVTSITLDELLESGAWDGALRRSWERSLETLVNRKQQLEGMAVASDQRLEAFLFHRRNPRDDSREIVTLGSAGDEPAQTVLGILIRHLSGKKPTPVTVSRVSREEIDFRLLESWGFRKLGEYTAYAATATAG